MGPCLAGVSSPEFILSKNPFHSKASPACAAVARAPAVRARGTRFTRRWPTARQKRLEEEAPMSRRTRARMSRTTSSPSREAGASEWPGPPARSRRPRLVRPRLASRPAPAHRGTACRAPSVAPATPTRCTAASVAEPLRQHCSTLTNRTARKRALPSTAAPSIRQKRMSARPRATSSRRACAAPQNRPVAGAPSLISCCC